MVVFKSKQKKFEGDLKVKLCGKRSYPTESVNYLRVKTDTNLSWQYHVHDLSPLQWIELMLFSLKWENMLVLKKLLMLDTLEEINFQLKLFLKISNFFIWKLLFRQKKKVEGHGNISFRKFGEWWAENLSQSLIKHKHLATWLP